MADRDAVARSGLDPRDPGGRSGPVALKNRPRSIAETGEVPARRTTVPRFDSALRL